MLTRLERAKQFQPFDAMKGLQEALRKREERHARTEKREISEDLSTENSEVISTLSEGKEIMAEYYSGGHDMVKSGIVEKINFTKKFLVLEGEKIYFKDVYSINVNFLTKR